MNQKFKKIISNKIFFIVSVLILSLILSLAIHSVRAEWKAPVDNAPDGNVSPPVYNDVAISVDDKLYAQINRDVVVAGALGINNSFRLGDPTLAGCDTLDTDSAGYVVCGSDNAGSGIIDINTQTTGSLPLSRTSEQLPYSRVSGTPPSIVCDWSGIRNPCGDDYTITCTGGVVTRVAVPTPEQSTNPSAACFVPACFWEGLYAPCGDGTTPTCYSGVFGPVVAQIPYQTINPAAACYFEIIIPPIEFPPCFPFCGGFNFSL